MKKSTKGLIAAAAGVTLLTGVGGTFANWSENQTVAGGTVTAGSLEWTVGTAAWSDQNGPIDPAVFKMVPGDVVTYSTTVTPELDGTNLTATLSAVLPAESGTLADDVVVNATFDGGTASKVITEINDSAAVPVTVTVTLPDTIAGDVAETESLVLSDLELSLLQN